MKERERAISTIHYRLKVTYDFLVVSNDATNDNSNLIDRPTVFREI